MAELLRDDGELVLWRGVREGRSVLLVSTSLDRPTRATARRLEHEFELRAELDPGWAARPLALERSGGNPVLVLEDTGGSSLESLVGQASDAATFMQIAAEITAALGKVHERGLVHKDVKPGNVLVDASTGAVRLTGFGIATRVPRERQAPEPPELVAGTLPYMAPEQTGRMNRSIDSRSDLYSLGVTLYQLLTGALPFEASDPSGWVHCHLAHQPRPPVERVRDIPSALSEIVMKLLAKNAEDRYQTAAGLEADLRDALTQWESRGRIDLPSLGVRDAPDRLLILEKLYGREREIGVLLAAFERVVRLGGSELVLVSGYAGVGKSSLVNELHKVIVLPRGLFGSGKFDRHRRDVPYETLAQVFRGLVRQILSMSDEEVGRWRGAIRAAVGTNGRLLVDVVPELEHLIGEQPNVPELPPQEAQNRFHALFRRFVGVFASAEHPLVLFLDDLQWLDAASLELLQHLVTHPDVRHLLFIGAYRDNEVNTSHPLLRSLDAIRRTDAIVREIVLQPLGREDVELLVAETLRSPVRRAQPLAALVHEKTGGNPFFAIQFLTALAEEGLLEFDGRAGAWAWDVDRIREKGFTDNVVDLVVAKLNRLPETARRTLELLACLGNRAEASTLTLIRGGTDEGTHEALWEAVRAGLVLRLGDTYAFAHDRVQEAAYALVPVERRPAEHVRIGRLLMAQKTAEEIEASPFEVVNQLNRGVELIGGPDEQAELCRLDFLAGREAKAAGAYASAHSYLAQAESLLPGDAWSARYEETFALYLELSECEYLVGNFDRADELFNLILEAARSDRDRARGYILRVKLYQLSGRYDDGMSVSLEALRLFGVTLPESDRELEEVFAAEVRAIDAAMRGRRIADLVDAPLASDPDARTVISLLAEAIPCSYIARPRLFPLVAAKGMNVCLEHGITPDSCRIYLNYGALLVTSGEIANGVGFSEAALRLNDRFDDPRLRGKLLHSHGAYVNHWRRHLATSLPLQEQAFAACVETGDLVFAGYAAALTMATRLESGEPLDDVLEACRRYLAFARQSKNDVLFQFLRTVEQFVASLQGTTREPGSLDDETFEAADCVAYLTKAGFGAGVGTLHTLSQVTTFTYGRFVEALQAAHDAEPWLPMIAGSVYEATHHFFYALTVAALYPDAQAAEQERLARVIAEKLAKLKHWADNCPENFAHRHALVAAELARIEGREVDATRLYDDAIRSARENGFLQIEALSFELAARFFQARGLATAAEIYLREAHLCYARWGAEGKVRRLEELHPQVRSQESLAARSVFHGLGELDALAVTKASQAISSEIVLEQLLDKLMRIVLESAGADRGVLLVPDDDRLSLAAEATAHDEQVTVRVELRRTPSETTLPRSIVDYVRRSREPVLLDNAREESPFSADLYLAYEQPKSVLCLAVVRHGELVGVLYLENTLASHAFTPDRLQVVELLAAQAAISLENARLYAELERLFTLSRDAIVTVGFDGALRSVNPAFAELLGYSADELLGRSTLDFVHSDDRDRSAAELDRVVAGAASVAFENRTVGEDGTVRWLEWTAIAEPERELVYAIARDVTDRKLAEEEHDRLEMELRQAQKMEAVGRLAGGVAHDFNNLLTAISGYSEFLLEALPEDGRLWADAEEIRRAAERAKAVTQQLLAFSRRQLAQSVIVDLNEVVTDMTKLLRRLIGADIELVTVLAPELGRVEGDRGQFEQVIVNLALNARDAMPRGGKLVIETAHAAADPSRPGTPTARLASGDYVRISVRDTGAGMDEDTRAHIFEPFFTTKGVGRGTGLGLATVFGIVEGCGGRIFVDSEVGSGTTFEIYLPQTEQPSPLAEQPGPVATSTRGSETVLLVDDEEILRAMAGRALRQLGYKVVEARYGTEALELWSKHRDEVDVLVTDIVMPGLSGVEVAQQIAVDRPDVAIVIMSGYADAASGQQLPVQSQAVFLEKPFTPSVLVDAVRDAIRKWSQAVPTA